MNKMKYMCSAYTLATTSSTLLSLTHKTISNGWKARSEELKQRINHEEADGLMDRAIELYLNEQQVQGSEKKMGYHKVCEKVEEDHRKETGCTVKLNHNTLANRVK
jgi:hypothetical protein